MFSKTFGILENAILLGEKGLKCREIKTPLIIITSGVGLQKNRHYSFIRYLLLFRNR